MTAVTDLKESSGTNDLASVLSVAENPTVPIFSRFLHSERILWPEDDAGDAGDRLEAVLAQIEKVRIFGSWKS